MSEYDEPVLEYQNIIHGYYNVKLKNGDGFQDEVKKITLYFYN